MDIGTLTGAIAIEDQVTGVLSQISNEIKSFARDWDGALGAMATSAGLVTLAVGGIVGAITALGVKGSTINGVEESFDKLARSIGSTGEELTKSLSEGVKNTVDSVDLMTATVKLLDSGVKVTAEDFKMMGSLARELGKATGTSATQGLNQLSQALLTGNARSIRRLGIQVDLVAAEKKFREQLGGTTEALNEAGRLEVRRIALLDGMRTKLETTGESALSFKERIQQSTVAVGNWFDNLAKAVDKSPHVLAAFDAIKNAIARAFGTDSDKLLDSIVGWINYFADQAAYYGPIIIDWLVSIKDAVVAIWQSVQEAWDLVPDWFKRIATESALAATAVGAVTYAFGGMSIPMLIDNVGSLATTWALFGDKIKAVSSGLVIFGQALFSIGKYGGISALIDMLAISITNLTAAMMASPLFLAALAVGAAYGVVQLTKAISGLWDTIQKGESVAAFFGQRDEDNFIRRMFPVSWLAVIDSYTLAIERYFGVFRQAKSVIPEGLEAQRKMLMGFMERTPDLFGPPSPAGYDFEAEQAKKEKKEQDFTTASEKLKKYLENLRKGDEDLRMFEMAFKSLTAAELDNFTMQERLAPSIMKLVAAGRQITPAMQGVLDSYIATRVQLEETDMATLKHLGVTQEHIDSLIRLGMKEAEIAQSFGVSVEGLQRYSRELKNTADNMDRLANFEEQFREQERKTRERQVAIEKQAGARLEEEYEKLQDMKRQQSMTTLEYELFNIKKWEASMIAAYSLTGASAAQVAAFSDYVRQQAAMREDKAHLDQALRDYYEFMKKRGEVFKEAGRSIGSRLSEGIVGSLEALPGIIQDAFTGGGGIGGALKAIFVNLATSIGRAFTDTISAILKKIKLIDTMGGKQAGLGGLGAKGVIAAGGLGALAGGTAMAAGATGSQALGSVAGAAVSTGMTVGMISGATSGVIAGAATMGIGAAVVGAIVLYKAKHMAEWEKLGKDIGRDFGVALSEETLRAMEDTSKAIGRQATGVLFLKDIMEAAGGAEKNVKKFTSTLHDAFIMNQQGKLSFEQLGQVMEQNFGDILRVNTDSLGHWSDEVKHIIKMNQEWGLETEAVTEALEGMAKQLSTTFYLMVGGMQAARDPWIVVSANINAAKEALDIFYAHQKKMVSDEAFEEAMEKIGLDAKASLADVEKVYSGYLTKQKELANAARGELNDLADAMSTTVLANMAVRGQGFFDAIRENEEAIGNLGESFRLLGLEAEDPFAKMIFMQQEIMKNAPALTAAIDSYAQRLVALDNLDLLDAAALGNSARTAHQAYVRLQREVELVGGTTKDALLPFQQYLHEAQRAAEKLEIPLDANIQSMIDQSKQLGIWKDLGPDAQELMLKATQDLTVAIEALKNAFLGIGPAAEEAAGRASTALGGVEGSVNRVIQEQSPTGLEGIIRYAGLAGLSLQQMSKMSAQDLSDLAKSVGYVARELDQADIGVQQFSTELGSALDFLGLTQQGVHKRLDDLLQRVDFQRPDKADIGVIQHPIERDVSAAAASAQARSLFEKYGYAMTDADLAKLATKFGARSGEVSFDQQEVTKFLNSLEATYLKGLQAQTKALESVIAPPQNKMTQGLNTLLNKMTYQRPDKADIGVPQHEKEFNVSVEGATGQARALFEKYGQTMSAADLSALGQRFGYRHDTDRLGLDQREVTAFLTNLEKTHLAAQKVGAAGTAAFGKMAGAITVSKDAVDGFLFGSSPGGLIDIPPMADAAASAVSDLARATTEFRIPTGEFKIPEVEKIRLKIDEAIDPTEIQKLQRQLEEAMQAAVTGGLDAGLAHFTSGGLLTGPAAGGNLGDIIKNEMPKIDFEWPKIDFEGLLPKLPPGDWFDPGWLPRPGMPPTRDELPIAPPFYGPKEPQFGTIKPPDWVREGGGVGGPPTKEVVIVKQDFLGVVNVQDPRMTDDAIKKFREQLPNEVVVGDTRLALHAVADQRVIEQLVKLGVIR